MKEIRITEEQLNLIVNTLKEDDTRSGSYMAKQQLFVIATMAYKMWEEMEDGEVLEDWMETKIAQAEQSLISVVKAYLYDEITDDMKGMETLNYNEIVIGK